MVEVVKGGLDMLPELSVLGFGEVGDIRRRASNMSFGVFDGWLGVDVASGEEGRGDGWRGRLVSRRIPMRVGRNSFVLVASGKLGGGNAVDRGVGHQGCLLLLFSWLNGCDFLEARGS